jgi:hypothetical protein
MQETGNMRSSCALHFDPGTKKLARFVSTFPANLLFFLFQFLSKKTNQKKKKKTYFPHTRRYLNSGVIHVFPWNDEEGQFSASELQLPARSMISHMQFDAQKFVICSPGGLQIMDFPTFNVIHQSPVKDLHCFEYEQDTLYCGAITGRLDLYDLKSGKQIHVRSSLISLPLFAHLHHSTTSFSLFFFFPHSFSSFFFFSFFFFFFSPISVRTSSSWNHLVTAHDHYKFLHLFHGSNYQNVGHSKSQGTCEDLCWFATKIFLLSFLFFDFSYPFVVLFTLQGMGFGTVLTKKRNLQFEVE